MAEMFLNRRTKGVIIGKVSCRVLMFLRAFVRKHISQDVEKQESSSHGQKENRRERARAEEIVKVSVSFSLACFAHFSFCFS